MGQYRFVEDVALADCAIDVDGRDPGDVLETAAAALAELMVDPASLDLTVSRRLAVEAPELDLLLYDWLSELIFLKDRDGVVFTKATVRITGSGPYKADAELLGGIIDRARTTLRADAKAATFHQLALERRGEEWQARVVIDI